jgi:hypothetical protein
MRPGNRYARERGYSRTLGQLVESKMALVAICRRCKHQCVLYPANFIERFGADCPAISNCASTCAAGAAAAEWQTFTNRPADAGQAEEPRSEKPLRVRQPLRQRENFSPNG